MSYETHVTMAINVITTSIYVYAVFELITVCLSMITLTAKTVPPTDFLSMLFNLWFGIMTFGVVNAFRPMLSSLFSCQKSPDPVCSFTACNEKQSALKFTMYGKSDEAVKLGCFLFSANAAASMPPNNAKLAKSTPDEEARSQADTETSEIKPVV